MSEHEMSLYVDRGGWCVAFGGDVLGDLAVRFALTPDERLAVAAVRWSPGETVNAAAWRRVPIAAVETLANSPEVRATIVRMLDHEPTEMFQTLPIHIRRMRTGALQLIEGWANPRIPRPPRGRYPDEFYQRVARVYRWHVKHHLPPAPALAEANGVPISTAHRWIREARDRKILSAGKRGRAG